MGIFFVRPAALRATGLAGLLLLPALPQSARPEFEVADVKPNTSANPVPSKGGFLPGGRVDLPNITLRQLIAGAYNLQPDMLAGGPKWLDSDRFDIVAKAPPETSTPTLQLMLQSLLADRFKVVLHQEDKTMPVYALVVAKGGPKLPEASPTSGRSCRWTTVERTLMRRDCQKTPMATLAGQLAAMRQYGIDRPVVDLTGLKGEYDFHFEIDPRNGAREPRTDLEPAPADRGPTIFDAMAQLGLKLEPRSQAVPVTVIDRAERPVQ